MHEKARRITVKGKKRLALQGADCAYMKKVEDKDSTMDKGWKTL